VKGVIHWATGATASSAWVDPTTASTAPSGALGEVLFLDTNVSIEEIGRSTVDPVKAGLGGIIPAEHAAILLVEGDVIPIAVELSTVAKQPANAANAGNADRVAQFEERIKSLEAELKGLREALQQFKSVPAAEKSK
jgi:hypothetical protein